MKMFPFDLEKAKAGHPICTRDGREVQFVIHATNACDSHKVVIMEPNGEIFCCYENGLFSSSGQSSDDLFLIALEPLTTWVNLYPNGYMATAVYYTNKEDADKNSGVGRIACLSFVEGQGIEESK